MWIFFWSYLQIMFYGIDKLTRAVCGTVVQTYRIPVKMTNQTRPKQRFDRSDQCGS